MSTSSASAFPALPQVRIDSQGVLFDSDLPPDSMIATDRDCEYPPELSSAAKDANRIPPASSIGGEFPPRDLALIALAWYDWFMCTRAPRATKSRESDKIKSISRSLLRVVRFARDGQHVDAELEFNLAILENAKLLEEFGLP